MDKLNATQTRASRILALRIMMGGSPGAAPGYGLTERILSEIVVGTRKPSEDMVKSIREEAEGREARWRKLMRIEEPA